MCKGNQNMLGYSPIKKANMQVPNSNQNTNQKQPENIERIQVTIPNPLLMPNASVQIQY